MKLLALTFVLGAVVSSAYGQTTVNGRPAAPGALIFEDNFDELDFTVWQHERTMAGGGNWEFQIYDNTRNNSFCDNGILKIVPTLTNDHYNSPTHPDFVMTGTVDLNGGSPADSCTNPGFYGCMRSGVNGAINPIQSARIRTVNSFSFKYGRVEVRAKMPTGDWLWPAIWMLPRYNVYGLWPASGEIDIVESRGNNRLMLNGVNIGNEQVGSTLHWGPHWPVNGYPKTTWPRNNPGDGYNKGFHKYEVIWTPESITFKLDDTELGKVTPPAGGFWEYGEFKEGINPWRFSKNKIAPFDQEFYLIINLAVGGTAGYFPDAANNEGAPGKPWRDDSPAAATDFWRAKNGWYDQTWVPAGNNTALEVDYIRVWAL